MQININSIMQMIPHRYPLLLVDRVTEIEMNKSIIGIKNVTFNEPHFMGHFPDNPVMPGVLVIEALAQLSAILVGASIEKKMGGIDKDNTNIYFMSIDVAKFRWPVTPGDTLILKSEIERNRGFAWKFSAKAFVEEKLVTETKFTAMIKSKND